MPKIGDTVGVEVADPFNPDADPDVRPGFVVNVESRDDGEADTLTVVAFNKDGSQSVHHVAEGAGLTSLDDYDDDDDDYLDPIGDGQAGADTIGDGTPPQASPSSFGNTH